MKAVQKQFVRKVLRNIFLSALLLIVAAAFHRHFADWISHHREVIGAAALVVFAIVFGMAKRTQRLAARAETQAAFSELMDDYPWLKMFYVFYAIAIVIGVLYSAITHVYLAELLERTGFIGLVGLFMLLGVPVGIASLLRSYDEAGREDSQR